MNGMHVFTLKSRANDLLLPDGGKLSVLLTFHINSMPIWRLERHLWIIGPLEYNLCLPWDMSFYLVPRLPRLVTIVAKFFMCEGKVSNLIYYFWLFYLFIFYFY